MEDKCNMLFHSITLGSSLHESELTHDTLGSSLLDKVQKHLATIYLSQLSSLHSSSLNTLLNHITHNQGNIKVST